MGFARKMEIGISGKGVITAAGPGVAVFEKALRSGQPQFSYLALEHQGQLFKFPSAKIGAFDLRASISALNLPGEITKSAKRLRKFSKSTATGIYCALEAWSDAGLLDAAIDLDRVAIVSAGSNIQQAYLYTQQERYREQVKFMNPTYALHFFDTDLIGAISELLKIKGEGHSIGAASASGNLAVIQGLRLLRSGDYDIALVIAPCMDLSIFEYQAFTSLGAMAVFQENITPDLICRPFDTGHQGFVHGQMAGCLVLESMEHAEKRGKQCKARLAGFGVSMDANRNPNPSAEGEKKAMENALSSAGITARQIDYVNTHGTASVSGDQAEVAAILMSGLEGVLANSTKSIIGHGLSAAGLVECIACLIQMEGNFVHPTHNLEQAISDQINWGATKAIEGRQIQFALNNSFAFGGMNTALVLVSL